VKSVKRTASFIKDVVLGFPKYWGVILVIIAVGLLFWVGYGVYVQGRGWADWTGFGEYTSPNADYHPAKTLWDWLDLLIIPIVLAIGAWWLNKTEREAEREAAEKRAETDREIALDRQRQATLQAYYDRMTDLLLEKNLRNAQENDPVRDVARTQTLATLPSLDGARKGQIVQFLYEADLIYGILTLERADLREADLGVAYLREADLSGANLREVNLSGAYMPKADLSWATLSGADLREADLSGANLREADLSGADLREASLSEANLERVTYDARTRWPDGFDPKTVGTVLKE